MKHTCCDGGSGGVNDGGVEVGLTEGGCHTSSDTQHLSEGVFVSMRHLTEDKRYYFGLRIA